MHSLDCHSRESGNLSSMDTPIKSGMTRSWNYSGITRPYPDLSRPMRSHAERLKTKNTVFSFGFVPTKILRNAKGYPEFAVN